MKTITLLIEFTGDMIKLWIKGIPRCIKKGNVSYSGITRFFYGKNAEAERNYFVLQVDKLLSLNDKLQ